MWVRCVFTVASVIPSRVAASRLLSPSTTRCTICCSRALRRSPKASFPTRGLTDRAASSATVRAITRDLAHHEERTIRAEEATEAGPEKGAVTQERDADRRGRNRRRRCLRARDNALTFYRPLPVAPYHRCRGGNVSILGATFDPV